MQQLDLLDHRVRKEEDEQAEYQQAEKSAANAQQLRSTAFWGRRH